MCGQPINGAGQLPTNMRFVIDVPKELLRNHRMGAFVARDILRPLIKINQLLLRLHPELPTLYNSGVKYRGEPNAGQYEDFANVLQVYDRQWGDCDDLVALRVAEIREREKRPAEPLIYWRPRKTGGRWHFQLRHWPDAAAYKQFAAAIKGDKRAIQLGGLGEVEDPSRLLGM